ncbi:MAG: hypothetical protein L3J12_01665, partial [Spirochaetales bacterium]|nr:hypothetical protein [Spirochaetales bacterium]
IGTNQQGMENEEQLFSDVSGEELSDEEMEDVEGLWVWRAISGAISGGVSAAVSVRKSRRARLSRRKTVTRAARSFAVGAFFGALTGKPVGIAKVFLSTRDTELH